MSRVKNVIWSKQAANPIDGTEFIGIYYSERRGYVACTYTGIKEYKTEKAARAYMRKLGYNC